MATYEQVLAGQTAAEEQNVSRVTQYNAQRQSEDRQASIDKLKSASHLSKALDGFIEHTVDKNIEDEKIRGKLIAIEEDFENKEGTGITNIPVEDQEEYYANKEGIKANKIELNEEANQVVEQGGSYQDANDVSNLSGWALYSYVQRKSKIAADGYEDWLKGEMNKNDKLKLNVNGVEFTPSTAETLDQKLVAMKALRRQYVRDNDLLDVNRALLDDKDVGFYDKVANAHKTLSKEYETDQDINDGITIREEAEKSFGVNKNFALLLGEIKRTRKPDGSKYDRKEALDETFKVIKNAYLNGDITEQQLLDMQEQEVKINGETYKAGRWRNRWRNLAKEVAEEKKALLDAEQDAFEAQGDKYIMDIQAKEKKLQDEGKRYSEEEIDEMINNWNPQWGKVDTYLTDLKTRSTEDGIDDGVIKILEYKIKKRLPIYQTEVNQISDSTKWAKWTKVAKDPANREYLKQETDRRDSAVKGVIVSSFFATVEKQTGNAWEAANTQAIEAYDDLMDAERPNHATFKDAHKAVMTELKPRIESGEFNEWEWEKDNAPTDQKYFNNFKLASTAYKLDPDYITRSVIPGTEDALQTYIDSGGTIVPKIYEDLTILINKGNPENPIWASRLAAEQAATVDNKTENIQSEIDKEIDELPKHVRQTLLRHPDQYKVARAKLELFKEDGDISYNDIEYLIHEVADMDIAKDNKTKPLTQDLQPRIGDWKDVDGIGYVVWDGEEWIRKGNKGRYRTPYLGNVDNYRDIDNFVKPYDGNYTGEIPLGAWQKLPNAVGYVVWDGKNWVRSGNKTRAAQYEGEVTELLDLDGEVKKLYE
tara:strand:- start:339 stop:2801 length:2463 start_codon:yes stop_codon:yes gene_type:complete